MAIFLRPAAACNFSNDLVRQAYLDKDQSESQVSKRRKLARMLESTNQRQGILNQDLNMKTLTDSVTKLKQVKIKVKDNVLNYLCRFLRKHRGHSSVQRMLDFYRSQLDI